MMKKIALLCLLLSPLSYGHFHYQIDSTATLRSNVKKQLQAVNFSWVYGQKVTDLMLQSGDDMNTLGRAVINDLAKLHYFTYLEFNNKRVATDQVTLYQLETITINGKPRLKLDFTLVLQSPLYLHGGRLDIIQKDTGDSASIFYRNATRLLLNQGFETTCKAEVNAIQGFKAGETPETVSIHCRR
ncbi:MAG: DUF1007 family protein [Cocleimonas sp.]|nr:DUF1007 family protein [Cocleimonas sp.]